MSPLQSLNIPVPLMAQNMPDQSDSTAQDLKVCEVQSRSLLHLGLDTLPDREVCHEKGQVIPLALGLSEIKVPSSGQWLDSGWLLLAPGRCHSWTGLICVPRKGSYEP